MTAACALSIRTKIDDLE